MKFDDLDKKMRVFETAHDICVLPEMYMVARIDGRGFTRLTKVVHQFEAPFDVRFRDLMVETTKHLMSCGFNVIYGYTESDEISLLFSLEENTFNRKTSKFNSILAGEASAKFSLMLKDLAAFDCRMCLFPNKQLVIDYFRWRNEDAFRNALNGHCYWKLREEGMTAKKANANISGKSVGDKNEILFQKGINFNDLPNWQKRGVGLYWVQKEMEGKNKQTGDKTTFSRREIMIDYDLPMKDEYSEFISAFIN